MIFIRNKNNTILFIISIISGLVIGGFIGDLVKNINFLSWLNYGKSVGLTAPLILDLEIISIQFSFSIKFTICGIIGMLTSILIYNKLC